MLQLVKDYPPLEKAYKKAIAVLLTLLHLGMQNIRLGSTLPAFITPNVLKFLADTYHLQPITTPVKDSADCLG